MMTHGAMLWEAALYNNGAFPFKDAHFGESYDRNGQPQRLEMKPPPTAEETRTKGILPYLEPLQRWEYSQPGNVLRVFERGGEKKQEVGNPILDDDQRQSRRQAELPRLRHLAAHRSHRPRPAEDAPARSAAVVPRHQRSARRLSRLADAAPATSFTPTTARRSTPPAMRSSATWGSRRPAIRRFRKASPAIR